MGFYIIEIKDKYKQVVLLSADGELYCKDVAGLMPYTEPDLGTLAKENFERGYRQRKAEEEKEIQEAYQRGLKDVWDAARKIAVNADHGGLSAEELREIFDVGTASIARIFDNFSASEAIEKIRQYEQDKEEIKVGDEVIPHHITADSTPVIVTRKWKDDYNQDAIHTIGYDGRTNCFLEEHVEKTGRHFEIAEILAKMKESANEN